MGPGGGGSGSTGSPENGPLGHVAIGGFELVVGDPAGLAITRSRQQAGSARSLQEGDSKSLARAIAKWEREPSPETGQPQERGHTAPQALEGAVEDASKVTSRVEHAKTLCSQVYSGELGVESVTNEVDALLGLARRLDRDGRFEEELRVARCASTLVTLTRRWLDLLGLLRGAMRAAEHAADPHAKAWAQHELGTLHLAAGRHAGADHWLSQARELRERLGDRHGLALTERNLQILCRTLRQGLHEPRRGRTLKRASSRPALALLAAIVLIAAGGAAGAAIDHSTRRRLGAAGDTIASRIAGPNPGPKAGSSGNGGPGKAITDRGKAQPEILLVCPRSPLSPEASAPAFGSVTPPRAGIVVAVAYKGPKSGETVRAVTDAAGVYSATFTPNEDGEWHVRSASAAGGRLLRAESRQCTFIVKTPGAVIDKAPVPKTSPPSPVPEQPSAPAPSSEPPKAGSSAPGPSTTETPEPRLR